MALNDPIASACLHLDKITIEPRETLTVELSNELKEQFLDDILTIDLLPGCLCRGGGGGGMLSEEGEELMEGVAVSDR